MTISTIDVSAGPYAGNGITDTFEYDFKVFDKSQLRVVQTDADGVVSVLVLDSDYTVTGVGTEGGDIITTVPLPVGVSITIRAEIAATQETDFDSQGGFYPDVHEDAFDKLTLLIQQLNYNVDRAVRLSGDSENGNMVFSEDVDGRRNKLMRFDNNGDIELVEFGSIEGFQNFRVETVQVTAGTTSVAVPFDYLANTGTVWLNANGAFVPRSAYTELATTVLFTNPLPAGEVTFFGISTTPIGTGDLANMTFNTLNAADTITQTVATLAELVALDAADFSGKERHVTAVGNFKSDGASWLPIDTIVTVDMFSAVGDDVTSDKNAFLDAQALFDFIYVPQGKNYYIGDGAGVVQGQFYGPGNVRQDDRPWQLSRGPQTAQTQKVYRATYGTYESAAGLSVVANHPNGTQDHTNTEVLGATTQGVAVYGGFDHVAQYVAGYSFASQSIPDAGATYTATTISGTGVSSLVFESGMLIRTGHSPFFVGAVQSRSGDVFTVDGWWEQTTGTAGTPANGTGAKLNPNSKVWAHNANVHLEATGDAESGTGFELGILAEKTGTGANTVGFDVVTLAGEDPYAHFISRNGAQRGFRKDGATTYGYDSEPSSEFNFWSKQTLGAGARIGFHATGGKVGHNSDADDVAFRALNPTSSAFEAVIGGARKFGVGSGGNIDGLFLNTTVAGGGATLSSTIVVAILTGTTVNLPAGRAASNPGVTIILANRNAGTCTVSGNGTNIEGSPTLAIPTGENRMLVSDGSTWLIIGNM